MKYLCIFYWWTQQWLTHFFKVDLSVVNIYTQIDILFVHFVVLGIQFAPGANRPSITAHVPALIYEINI